MKGNWNYNTADGSSLADELNTFNAHFNTTIQEAQSSNGEEATFAVTEHNIRCALKLGTPGRV